MDSCGFEKFIKGGLISTGHVSGVLLFSRQGQVMYRHGELSNMPQADVGQFLTQFGTMSKSTKEQMDNTDFILTTGADKRAIYKAYQKTYASVYATSTKGSGGLAVCNLPYSILVCVYGANTRDADAIKAIENFCDIMRR